MPTHACTFPCTHTQHLCPFSTSACTLNCSMPTITSSMHLTTHLFILSLSHPTSPHWSLLSSIFSPTNLSWICEVGCYQFLFSHHQHAHPQIYIGFVRWGVIGISFSLSESFWDWTDWASQYYKLGGGVLYSNWIWVEFVTQ